MVTIRVARENDANELTDLSIQLGYDCTLETCQRLFPIIAKDPDHIILVAESGDGVIAGYVHVFITKRLFLDPFSELGGLVVGEKFRGKGIGKILLAASENWATEQGCAEMRVRSNVLREEAHHFYLEHAYQDVKKQRVFLKNLGS